MNGATLVVRSIPWARPQAATQPSGCTWASTLASVWLPTASTAPAHRARASGRPPGSDSSDRSTMVEAPNAVR